MANELMTNRVKIIASVQKAPESEIRPIYMSKNRASIAEEEMSQMRKLLLMPEQGEKREQQPKVAL